MIKNILQNFQKLNFSVLPTPIYKLEKLSDFLSTNIYCLRDDLTGFALGGNKTRKLDYLIADALNQKADTLIAVGANQSNFCRITAAYGKVNNLEVHLVLAGEKPEKATGNLLLDHLFGANIHHIDTDDHEIITEEAKKIESELIKKGKKVYYLPMGGSVPIGTLGYIQAFDEIMSFSEKNNISFSSIIHASGSGGTQAGLVLGKASSSWKGQIIGISVGADAEKLNNIVNDLCFETIYKFNWNLSKLDIVALDAYTGEHYGAKTKEATEAIKLFASLEGIVLDEVYTGKAAAGLIDYARKKQFNKNDNILFIHTGGFVQLFE